MIAETPPADPDELDVAAKIADDHSDHLFAKLLRDRAEELRAQKEKHNEF